jgi:hypothetical protein
VPKVLSAKDHVTSGSTEHIPRQVVKQQDKFGWRDIIMQISIFQAL